MIARIAEIVGVVAIATVLISAQIALAQQCPPPHASVSTPVDSTYHLVFDDEFNGTSLDSTKWSPNWFGHNATQVTQPVNKAHETAALDPAQVTVSGGYLHLQTVSNPITIAGRTYPYRTGHVNTNPSFGLCTICFQVNPRSKGNSVYLESRAYIPATSGLVANWPSALITFGQNWPTTGEIDVAEGLSGYMTANYHSSAGNFNSGRGSSPYTGWHVFGALWTTSSVTYYYDGVQVKQYTAGVASAPNYLMLQNGIGTIGGANLVPADLMVDYVHVYSTDSSIPVVTPQMGYYGPGDAGPR